MDTAAKMSGAGLIVPPLEPLERPAVERRKQSSVLAEHACHMSFVFSSQHVSVLFHWHLTWIAF